MSDTSCQIDQPTPRVGVLLVMNSTASCSLWRDRPTEVGCWSIVGGKVDYLETLEQSETREEVGVEIRLVRLQCVTDHHLPQEAHNCEPEKIRQICWFPLGKLPPNLTITARNAIQAYSRLR